jgi:hypothetical protein
MPRALLAAALIAATCAGCLTPWEQLKWRSLKPVPGGPVELELHLVGRTPAAIDLQGIAVCIDQQLVMLQEFSPGLGGATLDRPTLIGRFNLPAGAHKFSTFTWFVRPGLPRSHHILIEARGRATFPPGRTTVTLTTTQQGPDPLAGFDARYTFPENMGPATRSSGQGAPAFDC